MVWHGVRVTFDGPSSNEASSDDVRREEEVRATAELAAQAQIELAGAINRLNDVLAPQLPRLVNLAADLVEFLATADTEREAGRVGNVPIVTDSPIIARLLENVEGIRVNTEQSGQLR